MSTITVWNENVEFLMDSNTILESIESDINFTEVYSIDESAFGDIVDKVIQGLKKLWEKIKDLIDPFIDAVARYFSSTKFYKKRKEAYIKKYGNNFIEYCLDRADYGKVLVKDMPIIDQDKLKKTSLYGSIINGLTTNKIHGTDTIIYNLFSNTIGFKKKDVGLDEFKTYLHLYFLRDKRETIKLNDYIRYISSAENTLSKVETVLKDLKGKADKAFKQSIKSAEEFKTKFKDMDEMANSSIKNLTIGMKATSMMIAEHINAIKEFMKDVNQIDTAYWKYIDELAKENSDDFFNNNDKKYSSDFFDSQSTDKPAVLSQKAKEVIASRESTIYNF